MKRLALGLATLAYVALPLTSSAQTAPTPTASTTCPATVVGCFTPPGAAASTPTPAPTTTLGPNDIPRIPGPSDPCAGLSDVVARECRLVHQHDPAAGNPNQATRDFLNGMVPDVSGGAVPVTNYDLGSSGSLQHGAALFWGLLMAGLFGLSTIIASAGLWLISWAYSFNFAHSGSLIVGQIDSLLQTRIIGPLGLGQLAITIVGFVVAFNLIFRRAHKAMSEVAVTILVLILGSFLLADPAHLVRSTLKAEQGANSMLLGLADPAPTSSGTSTDALTPLKRVVIDTLVKSPHERLDWSQHLTGRCAAIRDELVASGPWNDSDTPRNVMRQAPECRAFADFNEAPTFWRALGAAGYLCVSIVSLFLLALMSLVVGSAQWLLIFLTSITRLAVLVALIPKVRAAAAKWWEGILKTIFVTLTVSFLLAYWSIAIQSVLRVEASAALIAQAVDSLIVAIAMIVILRRAIHGSASLAHGMAKGIGGKDSWLQHKPPMKTGADLGLAAAGVYELSRIRNAFRGGGRGASGLWNRFGGGGGTGGADGDSDGASSGPGGNGGGWGGLRRFISGDPMLPPMSPAEIASVGKGASQDVFETEVSQAAGRLGLASDRHVYENGGREQGDRIDHSEGVVALQGSAAAESEPSAFDGRVSALSAAAWPGDRPGHSRSVDRAIREAENVLAGGDPQRPTGITTWGPSGQTSVYHPKPLPPRPDDN